MDAITDDKTGTGKCPVMHGTPIASTFGVPSNRDWWPNPQRKQRYHSD